MITYDNYYGISKEEKPEKYELIRENVDDFFYFVCGAEKGTDVTTLDIKTAAENYLRKGGLDDEEIERIEEYLTR